MSLKLKLKQNTEDLKVSTYTKYGYMSGSIAMESSHFESDVILPVQEEIKSTPSPIISTDYPESEADTVAETIETSLAAADNALTQETERVNSKIEVADALEEAQTEIENTQEGEEIITTESILKGYKAHNLIKSFYIKEYGKRKGSYETERTLSKEIFTESMYKNYSKSQILNYYSEGIKATLWKVYDTILKYLRKIQIFIRKYIAKIWFYFRSYKKEAEATKATLKDLNKVYDNKILLDLLQGKENKIDDVFTALGPVLGWYTMSEFDFDNMKGTLDSFDIKGYAKALRTELDNINKKGNANIKSSLKKILPHEYVKGDKSARIIDVPKLAKASGGTFEYVLAKILDIDTSENVTYIVSRADADIITTIGIEIDAEAEDESLSSKVRTAKFTVNQEDLKKYWEINIAANKTKGMIPSPEALSSLLTYIIKSDEKLKEIIDETMSSIDLAMQSIDRLKSINRVESEDKDFKGLQNLLKISSKMISNFLPDYLYGYFYACRNSVTAVKNLAKCYYDIIGEKKKEKSPLQLGASSNPKSTQAMKLASGDQTLSEYMTNSNKTLEKIMEDELNFPSNFFSDLVKRLPVKVTISKKLKAELTPEAMNEFTIQAGHELCRYASNQSGLPTSPDSITFENDLKANPSKYLHLIKFVYEDDTDVASTAEVLERDETVEEQTQTFDTFKDTTPESEAVEGEEIHSEEGVITVESLINRVDRYYDTLSKRHYRKLS